MFRALIRMCECISQGTEGLSHFCGFLPAPDCLADSETLLRTFPPKCWPRLAWISSNFWGNISRNLQSFPILCSSFCHRFVRKLLKCRASSFEKLLNESCNGISFKKQPDSYQARFFRITSVSLVTVGNLMNFPSSWINIKNLLIYLGV